MLHRLRLTATHLWSSNPLIPLPRSGLAAMSTFTLPNSKPEIPIHLTSDLSQEQLLSFPAFKTWISTLQHSLSTQQNKSHTFHSAPYKLRDIDIQSVDFFGGKRIGFIKLKAEVSNDNGERLPGSVFVCVFRFRGSSFGQNLESRDMAWECSNIFQRLNYPSKRQY